MQQIKNISIKRLVLWTENPRDPISPTAKDQDVVDRASADKKDKWQLRQLAQEMGALYDFSELPTVVYHDSKPVVYDGNRRVILAKIVKKYVKTNLKFKSLPDVPDKIPCNVCSEDVALDNIIRKHSKSGTWAPLERDIFMCKYKQREETAFMLIDKFMCGCIRDEHELNQGFVRDEIFSASNLSNLGFRVENGMLWSIHNDGDAKLIIDDVFDKVRNKLITTRTFRGKLMEILSPNVLQIIAKSKDNNTYIPLTANTAPTPVVPTQNTGSSQISGTTEPKDPNTSGSTTAPTGAVGAPGAESVDPPTGLTPIANEIAYPVFNKKYTLKRGHVNDLYRDIQLICTYYENHKKPFSKKFWALIRMSMRLIIETAARSENIEDINEYTNKYFSNAKKLLNADAKTYLSNFNVRKDSIAQLLHTGAHNYVASASEEQTKAIALIVESMLCKSHGKTK